jgi:hypothetical protein
MSTTKQAPKSRPLAVVIEPTGEAQPEAPEFQPVASASYAEVIRYRPTVTVTKGTDRTEHTCQHPNAHITKESAEACARQLARKAGVKELS